MNKLTYDYNNSFAAYYQWQLVANITILIAIVLQAFGQDRIPSELTIFMGLGFWLVAMIIGMISMAKKWPTGEVRGFWSGAKVALLNYSLLGYRQIPIGELPWKTVLTWGIVAAVSYPNIVGEIIKLEVVGATAFVFLVMITTIFAIFIMWGIGKILGLIFNK